MMPGYQDRAEKHPDASPIANHEISTRKIGFDHWGTSNAVIRNCSDEPAHKLLVQYEMGISVICVGFKETLSRCGVFLIMCAK